MNTNLHLLNETCHRNSWINELSPLLYCYQFGKSSIVSSLSKNEKFSLADSWKREKWLSHCFFKWNMYVVHFYVISFCFADGKSSLPIFLLFARKNLEFFWSHKNENELKIWKKFTFYCSFTLVEMFFNISHTRLSWYLILTSELNTFWGCSQNSSFWGRKLQEQKSGERVKKRQLNNCLNYKKKKNSQCAGHSSDEFIFKGRDTSQAYAIFTRTFH
jgi:hypothetical protein